MASVAAPAAAASEPCWTELLPPLAARGVLPGLPPLARLRNAVCAAMAPLAAPLPTTQPATAALFPASALLAAVEGCVADTAAIPPPARPAACLLVAAVAQEHYVRAHSTRARLLRTGWSEASAAAGSAATGAAAAASAAADDGSLRRFLTSQPPQVVALALQQALGEPDSQLGCLMNRVLQFGPEGVEVALRRTLMAVRQVRGVEGRGREGGALRAA